MDRTTSAPIRGFFINENYFRLWIGQAISVVGDFVFDITLVLWIATNLAVGESWAPIAVSGVLLAATVPSVLLGPFAGVFVDRWDKRKTMLVMDALRAGLVGLLLVFSEIVTHALSGTAARNAQLVGIYLVVVAVTVCAQFFNPSRLALIGDVVDPSVRTRATGLGQTTMYLAAIVGPSLAGPLYFHFGMQTALLLNALSFVGSFIAILLVRAPRVETGDTADVPADVLRELRAGLVFFRRNRALVAMLVSCVLVMCGAGALNALDVFFVTVNLHTAASSYGFLSAAMGGGAVLGALLTSTVGSRFSPTRLFWGSLLVTSFGLILYSRMSSFWPAVVVLFLTGIPIAAVNVAVMPIVLGVTPREMLGRVSSVLVPTIDLASLGSIVVAGWLAGTLMAHFHAVVLGVQFGSVDTIFFAAGLLGIVAGIYAMVALRNVTQPAHTPEHAAQGTTNSSAVA